MTDRVLCVDDDPKILSAFQRHLEDQFELLTAESGADGLELLDSRGPFAVIISDMRMPGMDGVQFLTAVREKAPKSVRMMLTGCADLQTAVEAVNEGNIFRFLTKPCLPEHLQRAIQDGIEQYRLVMAEKELLENTLRGAIKVLTEVLSLTNPMAFGHASQLQRLVRKVAGEMNFRRSWQLEIAAMLSQIGCVTVPPETLQKAQRGRPLSRDEIEILKAHPAIGSDLLRHIPRMGEIARIIACQEKGYDGSGLPDDGLVGEQIPLGARILKVCLDYERLTGSGEAGPVAVKHMREHDHLYDPAALRALDRVVRKEQAYEVLERSLKDVPMHAILADDVITPDGILIVGKGQEVTPSLCERLKNFARNRQYEDQIKLRILVEKKPESSSDS